MKKYKPELEWEKRLGIEERKIAQILKQRPITMEELQKETNMPYHRIYSILTKSKLKDRVKRIVNDKTIFEYTLKDDYEVFCEKPRFTLDKIYKKRTVKEIEKSLDNWKRIRHISKYGEMESQQFLTYPDEEPSESEIREEKIKIDQLSEKPFNLKEYQKVIKTRKKARNIAFSRKIMNLYNGACAVCGSRWRVDESFEAQAAHIMPKEENGTDDVRNGIALCRFHHWAFDKGIFTINESYLIIISPYVKEYSKNFETLKSLENNKINLPYEEESKPHKDALKWHLEHVFRK